MHSPPSCIRLSSEFSCEMASKAPSVEDRARSSADSSYAVTFKLLRLSIYSRAGGVESKLGQGIRRSISTPARPSDGARVEGGARRVCPLGAGPGRD